MIEEQYWNTTLKKYECEKYGEKKDNKYIWTQMWKIKNVFTVTEIDRNY